MLKIVASGGAKARRQKGQKSSHCFRFDGRVHGSRASPFAFIGTMLFDSSASAEHLHIRESSMSHAEYASKPLALLTKLAAILRIVPALQFVFARFAALLRSKESGEPLVREFLGEAPGVTRSTVDQHAAVLLQSTDHAVAAPETNDQSDREKLIRRRWLETGIKMWNPDVHGAGHAALNIQGRAELLSPKPGETLPGYDKLEFKMVQRAVNGQAVNRIVCEDVVVDPPTRGRPISVAIDPSRK